MNSNDIYRGRYGIHNLRGTPHPVFQHMAKDVRLRDRRIRSLGQQARHRQARDYQGCNQRLYGHHYARRLPAACRYVMRIITHLPRPRLFCLYYSLRVTFPCWNMQHTCILFRGLRACSHTPSLSYPIRRVLNQSHTHHHCLLLVPRSLC